MKEPDGIADMIAAVERSVFPHAHQGQEKPPRTIEVKPDDQKSTSLPQQPARRQTVETAK